MNQEKKYDVICVGQVNEDMFIMNVARNCFAENDLTYADRFDYSVGGDAANEAVIISRLGHRVGILAKIDQGRIGLMIRQELEAEGVDTSTLKYTESGENLVSLVLVRPDGSHDFILPKGKALTLTKKDYDLELFRHTRIVSAASLFGLGEIDTDGIEEIFRTVREGGGITVADTNYDLWNIGADGISKVYPYTDYLIPSYNEAVYITGEKEIEKIAEFFLERGVRHVVIKMGEKGCYFKGRGESFYTGAFPIQAVDTTGCGDNFTAAFIHGLLAGWEHQRIARFACACGALNAQTVGAHAGVKSEEQILHFMTEMQ